MHGKYGSVAYQWVCLARLSLSNGLMSISLRLSSLLIGSVVEIKNAEMCVVVSGGTITCNLKVAP